MVTVPMKLKDTCSLEEKLWPTYDSILKNRDITLLTKVCMDVRFGTKIKLSTEKLMLLNCGVGEYA